MRHMLEGILNEAGGLLGGICRLLRQAADLVRHHGKALTGISCAGGLNRGIQGQNVGLECNIVNDFDDALNVVGGLCNVADGGEQLTHLVLALLHNLTGLLTQLVSLMGELRGIGNTVGNIRDCRRELLDAAGLFSCTLGQSLGTVRHLIRTRAHLGRSRAQIHQEAANLLLEILNGTLNVGKVANKGQGALTGKVALGELRHAIVNGIHVLAQFLEG